MKLCLKNRLLMFLSGAILCTGVLADVPLPVRPDADKSDSTNSAPRLQEGLVGDVGLSPPVLDDIRMQGIRMPESVENPDEHKANGMKGIEQTQEKKE